MRISDWSSDVCSSDLTEADAQNQAQGRSGARAPSQIQLGFGADQKVDKPQTQQEAASERAVLKARPLAEAKTFLGTIPCLTGGTTIGRESCRERVGQYV